MLYFKTKEFMGEAKELKKKCHGLIMGDSLERMDDKTFNLVKEVSTFINQALDLIEEHNKVLDEVNSKMDTLTQMVKELRDN